ncbi:MAG: BolA/IbaG family iron-sulfur metabolism protein [Pseudomonadales bacterium]|nr:BolA/IbaG family iron-sulfur metabolism protein [Pseudomonadales bacterium]
MSVQEVIESKISTNLNPQYFIVENESHMHGGPATESHFKLTVVATDFEDMSLVKRHQNLYKILAEELAGSVHALALHLYTPAEWQARHGSIPESPDCRGGSKSAQ